MPLQEALLAPFLASPTRAFRSVARGAVHFGTDVGLRRSENQDRVAVASWQSAPSTNMGAMFALVVCDGMGGMQDGAQCAAIASSSFLDHLIDARGSNLRDTVLQATNAANNAVHERYGGRGGATLSAVVVGAARSEAIGVNVGDSRMYAIQKHLQEKELLRLTVDDNLKEAFGGTGRELLQFVGIGEGINPHLVSIISTALVVLTTDGAHFFDPNVFADVLLLSPDPKAIVERLIALSRWLGSPDNATVGVIDIQRSVEHILSQNHLPTEVWTAGFDGALLLVNYPTHISDQKSVPNSALAPGNSNRSISSSELEKNRARPSKKKRNPKLSQKGEQLTIDVEVKGGGSNDDNS